MRVECKRNLGTFMRMNLTVGKYYEVLKENDCYYLITDDYPNTTEYLKVFFDEPELSIPPKKIILVLTEEEINIIKNRLVEGIRKEDSLSVKLNRSKDRSFDLLYDLETLEKDWNKNRPVFGNRIENYNFFLNLVDTIRNFVRGE
jgi:adenylate kinase family enzyme